MGPISFVLVALWRMVTTLPWSATTSSFFATSPCFEYEIRGIADACAPLPLHLIASSRWESEGECRWDETRRDETGQLIEWKAKWLK